MGRKKKQKRGQLGSSPADLENRTCPCNSGVHYGECCAPFHKGERQPEDALELLRARFSAYALEEIDFIIDTTHPESEDYQRDRIAWFEELMSATRKTAFRALEVEEVQLGDAVAWVAYSVELEQPEHEASARERARFESIDEQWFYVGPEGK